MNITRTMRIYSALILITFIASVSILTGCSADGEGNASVKVHNDTDRTIRVYYTSSDEDDDSSSSSDTKKADNIRAGKTEEIMSRGDALSDPDIQVVYGGIVKQFTVSVNILGYGEIHIVQSDFYK